MARECNFFEKYFSFLEFRLFVFSSTNDSFCRILSLQLKAGMSTQKTRAFDSSTRRYLVPPPSSRIHVAAMSSSENGQGLMVAT